MDDKLYRIKKLKWSKSKSYARLETILGTMTVEIDEDETGEWKWGYCFDDYYDEQSFPCKSLEDGKKKAEAFYLKRLRKALTEYKETAYSSSASTRP